MRLTELDADPAAPFPPAALALAEPDGLLAWGGDLSPTRLLNAYRHGCFPWFSEGQPILWWSPDPRLVLTTDGILAHRSLRRWLRRCGWMLTADGRFGDVIRACGSIRRRDQHGTWIVESMIAAYERLHRLGHAHSVEVLDDEDRLIGGIYGVGIGRMFFGESMFSAADNGSKVALLGLCRHLADHGGPLVDCQMDTPHLRSLGAYTLPRQQFLAISAALCAQSGPAGSWTDAFGRRPAASLLPP